VAVLAGVVVASSRLFRRGVLVKSSAALERLSEVDHVVFDKTGVLTEGRPVLIGAEPELVAIVAPLARTSRHPLARAIARAAGDGPLAEAVVEHAGLGVEGLIDGRRARLGRAAFVGAPTLRAAETEMWFGFDDGPKVRLEFSDALGPDAAATIAALKARGLTVEILSGDQSSAVEAVAGRVGVAAWRAGLLPAEKSEAIDRLKAEGRKVLMVG